jgi:quinol monooxygenase YgiN
MVQRLLVVLKVMVPPAKRKEILQSIRPLLAPTRVLKGCIRIHFLQDLECPNALTLVEEWKSEGDLEYHLCSDEFKTILAVMEMSSKPPEIRFHSITKTSGLEFVTAARG